ALIVLGLKYTSLPDKRILMAIYGLAGILALLFLSESSSFGSFLLRVIFIAMAYGFFYYFRKRRPIQNTVILSFAFLLIGYASFLMLIIRSNVNPPINENTPKDAISLLTYLNREQYGDWPIFYGQYYNAPILERQEVNPTYVSDKAAGKYVNITDGVKTVPVYDPNYMTLFPRMWNSQESRYVNEYKNWSGIKRDPENKIIPSFGQNLKYFFKYQVGYMYFRYFMWNFAGRQNEIQGRGTLVNGNWVSGINFIDEWRLGPQDDLPENIHSKARNTFYFLPLILGLAGMFYQYKRRRKDWWVVMLLFIMTGIAIVVYLNQHAWQPRERDYAYAASFYAYAIWIGLGVLSVAKLLGRALKPNLASILAVTACFISVPLNMAYEGWDDHDRSGRYHAVEMAKNYLQSCAPNAILFTNGDNDTFPLWYAQEVEGVRTDVRVCNLSLLNADWYIDQMKRKAYESEPLPISLTWDQYKTGTRDIVYFIEQDNIKDYLDLPVLFNIIRKDEKKFKLKSGGAEYDFFPSKKFRIPVDSALVVENGTVPMHLANKIKPVEWNVSNFGIQKNHLILFDILAHNQWNRPIYFSITTGDDAYVGLQGHFTQEGMAYRLIPVKAEPPDDQIASVNTDVMYDNLMNRFAIGMADPRIFVSEDSYRSSMNLRNNYGRLAQALILEGKQDSAIQVCDRIVEMIPDQSVSYDYFMIPIADAYYATGATDKANAITERLFTYVEQNLQYFFRFSGDKEEQIDRYRQQYLAMVREIMKMTERYEQEDLHDRSKALFDSYYQLYVKAIT
ncbi:MAG: UbiA family prenyltransferase, partial [Bacteroidota bacterium]|nr:UbiA family prenyltransferase [Bacteroidota bacterium]